VASRPQFTPIGGKDDIPEIGVGVLGYRFMGRVHTNAYRQIPSTFWPPAARPRLVALCGRNAELVAAAARRYGYEGYYVDWRAMIEDARVQIVDNCGPYSLHVEPSIAALEAGKHVICEKPMALTSADAARMLVAARKSGRKHMCGFNYRFIPAVRLAREIIERGLLGKIYHFRGHYLQESAHDPDRPPAKAPDPAAPWVGSLLNLGSHLMDMARFIVGEPVSVSALMSTFEPTRPLASGERIKIEADDAFLTLLEFDNGAIGVLEASRVATGRKNRQSWEVNGSKGSLCFDLERLNELQVYLEGGTAENLTGFQRVLVTEAQHPFLKFWWPRGHILGWEHAHVNEIYHFVEAVVQQKDVAPYGATFEDGYRVAVISDAIVESARTGRRIPVRYEI
jgi:predicted dehydrogenase